MENFIFCAVLAVPKRHGFFNDSSKYSTLFFNPVTYLLMLQFPVNWFLLRGIFRTQSSIYDVAPLRN